MRLFDILAILISLSAFFSWLNYCLLRLPTAIGLMLIALAMSKHTREHLLAGFLAVPLILLAAWSA